MLGFYLKYLKEGVDNHYFPVFPQVANDVAASLPTGVSVRDIVVGIVVGIVVVVVVVVVVVFSKKS